MLAVAAANGAAALAAVAAPASYVTDSTMAAGVTAAEVLLQLLQLGEQRTFGPPACKVGLPTSSTVSGIYLERSCGAIHTSVSSAKPPKAVGSDHSAVDTSAGTERAKRCGASRC